VRKTGTKGKRYSGTKKPGTLIENTRINCVVENRSKRIGINLRLLASHVCPLSL